MNITQISSSGIYFDYKLKNKPIGVAFENAKEEQVSAEVAKTPVFGCLVNAARPLVLDANGRARSEIRSFLLQDTQGLFRNWCISYGGAFENEIFAQAFSAFLEQQINNDDFIVRSVREIAERQGIEDNFEELLAFAFEMREIRHKGLAKGEFREESYFAGFDGLSFSSFHHMAIAKNIKTWIDSPAQEHSWYGFAPEFTDEIREKMLPLSQKAVDFALNLITEKFGHLDMFNLGQFHFSNDDDMNFIREKIGEFKFELLSNNIDFTALKPSEERAEKFLKNFNLKAMLLESYVAFSELRAEDAVNYKF